MANLSRQAPTSKTLNAAEAKARVLELIAEGYKVEEAMLVVDRKKATYEDWRKNDEQFRAEVDSIRTVKRVEKETGKPQVPDFETFCREWLKQPLHPHQLRMWDVIEGREPRDMHESMNYDPGDPTRILINVPPDHAKSTTFTVNYCVWLIHKDPNVRIVITSQSSRLAERFLGEIKFKLTAPMYREMHLRFAPDGAWKDNDRSWTNDAIYVKGKGGDKDPTVQALGLSGQIYGARADVIVLDDIITTKNVREIEKQMVLLEREYESRLPPDGGLFMILGTRVAPIDLYRELRQVKNHDDELVWTYFRQPAVLDYGDGTSKTWETLWPEKWPGPKLSKRKRGEASWNLIYQQLDVDEDMTFKAEAVEASINGYRLPGPLSKTRDHDRAGGMDGLYVVGGLDPATVGNTAMIVSALDLEAEKRYVLDGFDKANCSPREMREKIKYFTDLYKINEWVIERNAFQRFLTQDDELQKFLRSRGCRLTEHYTTANKFDADFGIATMGPLFDSCGKPSEKHPTKWDRTPESALIELPAQKQNAWMQKLITQLVTWQPDGMAQKAKTDLVMALWFTEIAFNRLIKTKRSRTKTHMDNPFNTPARRRQQKTVSLTKLKSERALRYEQMEGRIYG